MDSKYKAKVIETVASNITSETIYPGLDGLARSMSCLRDSLGDYNAD